MKTRAFALLAILALTCSCGGGGGGSSPTPAPAPTPTPTPTPAPVVKYKLYGVSFSPYVDAQNPNSGTVIDDAQLTQQITALVPYTQGIRTFSCTNGLQDVAKIAKPLGLNVFIGVWIGKNATANNTEMQNCIAVAKAIKVDAVIIGSEALLRGDVTAAQLISYINQFRAAVPDVPITTADTYSMLEQNPSVVAVCDFVFANYYPFWEGVDITHAMSSMSGDDAYLRAKYAPKEVVVSETGWPSFGNTVGNAVPSSANAASYFMEFESWAQAGNRKTFYFEYHDEPWKGSDDGWGIWDKSLAMKSGMMDVFSGITVANAWTCNTAPGGSGTPTLQFTSVPKYGVNAPLTGSESHEVPSGFYVVVYIHAAGGWWIKPTAAAPLTPIACDGTWSMNFITGGEDIDANQITAFLIPTSYSPPVLLGAGSLPSALYTKAVANVTVSR